MPISNYDLLTLLNRSDRQRSLRYGNDPTALREQIRRMGESFAPRPPLEAAGKPMGGAGGFLDVDYAIEGLSHRPPEMAGQGPRIYEGPDTNVLSARAQELEQQKMQRAAMGILSSVPGFLNVAFSGPRVTGRVDQWSARDAKTDVSEDKRTLRELTGTPAVTYRYKGEPDDAPLRTGVIAETAPDRMTNESKTMVNLPEWLSMLEESVRQLAREVAALRGQG